MTLQDIKHSLEEATYKLIDGKTGCVLRCCPTYGYDFIEVDPKLAYAALEQIARTVTLLQTGLVDPSQHAAETLLLQILEGHAARQGYPYVAGQVRA